jgi:hypothetical protein
MHRITLNPNYTSYSQQKLWLAERVLVLGQLSARTVPDLILCSSWPPQLITARHDHYGATTCPLPASDEP